MKKKSLLLNKTAVSLVQDTLLFLVFISISAMILSPAVMQSKTFGSRNEYVVETKVQDSLQTLLSTTVRKYSYRTGSNILDPLAETIGINTNYSNGLYRTITTHIFGKEQYHKTIAQLITEQLATQYQIIMNNSTIQLNPFSGDSQQQLIVILKNELNRLLPSQAHYNLSAVWQPVHTIPFGGRITLGDKIPNDTSLYTSHQKVSMPFLPCMKLGNSTFYFSSYHLKNCIEEIIPQTSSLLNITYLRNIDKNATEKNISGKIMQNISYFLEDILVNGVTSDDGFLIIPSLLDSLFSSIFSLNSFSLTKNTFSDNSFKGFNSINSLFDTIAHSEKDYSDVSSYLISSFGQSLSQKIGTQILTTSSGFIKLIKKNIIQYIQPLIKSLSQIIFNHFFSFQQSVLTNITNMIDMLFSYLSLSTASISLTVWSV